MASKQSHHRSLLGVLLVAAFHPVKIITVYYIDCIRDIAQGIKHEIATREKYSGWER